MKLSNKAYDIAKWIAITALPVLGWLYGEVGPAWGFPYIAEITLTVDRVGVAFAILLGLSDYTFKENNTLTITPINKEEQ